MILLNSVRPTLNCQHLLKTQLKVKEVGESQELTRVRIHVERLIRMVKQKHISLDEIFTDFLKTKGSQN